MSELVHFSPRASLTAKENLHEFIRLCKLRSAVFGLSLDFDTDSWDVTDHIGLKGTRRATWLSFKTWRKRDASTASTMEEPFKSFAKSYLRYQQGLRPSKSLQGRLIALQSLHEVLAEAGRDMDPTCLLPLHFDRAVQLIRERVRASSCYQYAVQLELIYRTMAACGLLSRPQTWRSPVQRAEDASRIGPQFDARRMSRLPSPTALEALAAIFQVAAEPSDVVVTAAVAIMCSAPERVNEVLRLSIHSEVQQPSSNDAYGLRWFPAKGGAPQVKWTVRTMASVVRTAIARLRRISAPARALAEWYEVNPGRLFLSSDMEHFRTREWLTMDELLQILFDGEPRRTVAAVWCKTFKVSTALIQGRSYVRFHDVEAAVIRMLPRGFPFLHRNQGLRFADALFVLRKNEMHRTRATYRCMFTSLGSEDLYIRLSGGYKCRDPIFAKFGYREKDGAELSVTTHQFRHYLNTLAQLGGMSQLDIAAWSGRARVSDNKAYDHVSNRDVLQMMRDVVVGRKESTNEVTNLNDKSLVRRAEFASLKVRTAHTTDFGYCGHDFSMLPCLAHQDCINCGEHFCKKGELEKEARLRMQIEETRLMLQRAEEALQAGLAGADRWAERQRKDLERAEGVLRILQDPSVPHGAVIRPAVSTMPSRLAMAAQERQRLLSAPAAASPEGSRRRS